MGGELALASILESLQGRSPPELGARDGCGGRRRGRGLGPSFFFRLGPSFFRLHFGLGGSFGDGVFSRGFGHVCREGEDVGSGA